MAPMTITISSLTAMMSFLSSVPMMSVSLMKKASTTSMKYFLKVQSMKAKTSNVASPPAQTSLAASERIASLSSGASSPTNDTVKSCAQSSGRATMMRNDSMRSANSSQSSFVSSDR